jgi:hypothetical protein
MIDGGPGVRGRRATGGAGSGCLRDIGDLARGAPGAAARADIHVGLRAGWENRPAAAMIAATLDMLRGP